MVRGLPHIDHTEQICDCCVATKQRRTSFPQKTQYRAQDWLDLVHGDLCRAISPVTPGGKRHFLLLVDDYSRFMWVMFLSSKDQAVGTIKNWQASVEVETR